MAIVSRLHPRPIGASIRRDPFRVFYVNYKNTRGGGGMESLLYEARPYIMLGIGGGAEVMHKFFHVGLASEIGILLAYLLGALAGFILGMRVIARRMSGRILSSRA